MSEILFCDPGKHQFSANDPDRKTWTEQQSYNDANSGKKPMRFDACSEHRGYDGMGTDIVAEQAAALRKLMDAPKAVSAGKGKKLVDASTYDDYIRWMEEQGK